MFHAIDQVKRFLDEADRGSKIHRNPKLKLWPGIHPFYSGLSRQDQGAQHISGCWRMRSGIELLLSWSLVLQQK